MRDSQLEMMGFNCIGDEDHHPILGSLSNAKGWLHRPFPQNIPDHATSDNAPVSLAEALECGKLDLGDVRPPLGFICSTVEEQHAAFNLLRDHGYKVVIKPTDGLGCRGLVLDARRGDLENGTGPIQPCMVEEFVGVKNGPSPTVYMCGDRVLAIADQLMVDGVNEGNIIPSMCSNALQVQMAEAGSAIGRYLGLKSHWGMDFVIDTATGNPIIVDLNMGRPNGSLANYMWRSVQPRPPAALSGELHQLGIERRSPPGETMLELVSLLRSHGLLYTHGALEGVVPTAHVAGGAAKVMIVSWQSLEAVFKLASKLCSLDRAASYSVKAVQLPQQAASPQARSPKYLKEVAEYSHQCQEISKDYWSRVTGT